MTPPNILKFNAFAAQILAALYESFPVARHLHAGEFVDGGEAAVLDPAGFTGSELMPDAAFCISTVDWLAEAGYIRYRERDIFGFTYCVLTTKGLEVLSSVPDSLQTTQPLGERLLSVAKQSTKETFQVVVREILATGVRIAMHGA